MPGNCSHTFSDIVEMPNAYINGDRDEDVVYCEICLKTFQVSDYFEGDSIQRIIVRQNRVVRELRTSYPLAQLNTT